MFFAATLLMKVCKLAMIFAWYGSILPLPSIRKRKSVEYDPCVVMTVVVSLSTQRWIPLSITVTRGDGDGDCDRDGDTTVVVVVVLDFVVVGVVGEVVVFEVVVVVGEAAVLVVVFDVVVVVVVVVFEVVVVVEVAVVVVVGFDVVVVVEEETAFDVVVVVDVLEVDALLELEAGTDVTTNPAALGGDEEDVLALVEEISSQIH
jgi:hypothetical protein